MNKAVTNEVAMAEVTAWLDKKKVYPSTRETQKDSIDLLVEAIMAGDLTYDEDKNEFVHKLLFPDAVGGVTEFRYKARLNDRMLIPHLQGVKSNDADGRLLAHTAALTSQPKELLKGIDSADKKIMMSIAVFFL